MALSKPLMFIVKADSQIIAQGMDLTINNPRPLHVKIWELDWTLNSNVLQNRSPQIYNNLPCDTLKIYVQDNKTTNSALSFRQCWVKKARIYLIYTMQIRDQR